MIAACGFEWGSTLEPDILGSGGTYQVISTTSRSGTYCMRLYHGTDLWFQKTTPARSEIYAQVGFYIHTDSGNNFPILAWYNGTTQLGKLEYVGYARVVKLYVGNSLVVTGATILSLLTWNLLEVHVKIDDSVGILETRINGVADISFSGDTKSGAETTIDNVKCWSTANGGDNYYDDLVINDTAGTINNSWVDGASVVLLKPNAVGSTSQWAVVPAGTTHYQALDEVPPSSTDYITSTTSATLDLFGVEDPPVDTGQVLALGVDLWTQRVPGSTTSYIYSALNCPQGLQLSAAKQPTTSFALTRDLYSVNPKTSSRWTVSDVNSLETGVKIT